MFKFSIFFKFADKFAEFKEAARLAKEKSQEKIELTSTASQVSPVSPCTPSCVAGGSNALVILTVSLGLGTLHWAKNLLLVLPPLTSSVVAPQGVPVKRNVLSVNTPVKKKVTGNGELDFTTLMAIFLHSHPELMA